MKIFYKLPPRQKRLFILSKALVILLIIIMGVIAVFASGLKLPTIESQLSFSVGVILISLLTLLAVLNRIKTLFKKASVGFLTVFVILLCFNYTLDVLIWGTGLISIPLLIDDVILTPLWMNYYYNNCEDKPNA